MDLHNSSVADRGLSTATDDAWETFRLTGSEDARNVLVEHYLPIVTYQAERLGAKLPDSVDVGDLTSAGVFGLMDAIKAFDPERRVRFETYCVPRVRGAMLDELRRMDWAPRLVRSHQSKVQAATEAVFHKTGEAPRNGQLAAELGKTEEELWKTQKQNRVLEVGSIDAPVYETDSFKAVTRGDDLKDTKGSERAAALDQTEFLQKICRGLNQQERLILILYYVEKLTMKDIGEQLGLSESRISQMHGAMRRFLREKYGSREGFSDAAVAASLRTQQMIEDLFWAHAAIHYEKKDAEAAS